MKCRSCGYNLNRLIKSLGVAPLSNAYLKTSELFSAEVFYPLEVFLCDQCFLMQVPEMASPQTIFGDYAYFSSYSDSWLRHSQEYVDHMIRDFQIGKESKVVELASNDGYLLQYFQKAGVEVLGVEPAANVAAVAKEKGIPTVVAFFNQTVASKLVVENSKADLIVANNVLAHTPFLNDFVAGIRILLKQTGVFTIEFPHLLNLLKYTQFDTIYQEHFSYFSLFSVEKVFERHGMKIFDVAEIPTHGGSLRIYGCLEENLERSTSKRLQNLRKKESDFGIAKIETYENFGTKCDVIKMEVLKFLIKVKEEHKTIAGYGAPAKGNTLLNYCGVRNDLLPYTVDKNPRKQNTYLPGSRIPVFAPSKIDETKPDYVFILPWNLKDEIIEQMKNVKSWGGRFVVAVPELKVF